MIIIETCPKCGHDLQNEVICTNPPIPRKVCFACGWHWEGEPDREIIRVPFGGISISDEVSETYDRCTGTVTVTQLLNDITGEAIGNTVKVIEGTLNNIFDTAIDTFRSPEE